MHLVGRSIKTLGTACPRPLHAWAHRRACYSSAQAFRACCCQLPPSPIVPLGKGTQARLQPAPAQHDGLCALVHDLAGEGRAG